MKEITINEEYVHQAYKAGSADVRKVLEILFPVVLAEENPKPKQGEVWKAHNDHYWVVQDAVSSMLGGVWFGEDGEYRAKGVPLPFLIQGTKVADSLEDYFRAKLVGSINFNT